MHITEPSSKAGMSVNDFKLQLYAQLKASGVLNGLKVRSTRRCCSTMVLAVAVWLLCQW